MEKETQEGPRDKKCLAQSRSLVKREGQIWSVLLQGFSSEHECFPSAAQSTSFMAK